MKNGLIGNIFPIGFLLLFPFVLTAQKKLIQNSDEYLSSWKKIKGNETGITNDGKFICYAYEENNEARLIVIPTATMKADTLSSVRSVERVIWSRNNRSLLFTCQNDNLGIYDAIGKTFTNVSDVSDWKLFQNKAEETLVIRKNNGQMVVRDLAGKKSVILDSVQYYVKSEELPTIAVVSSKGITLVSLADKQLQYVSPMSNVSGLTFDKTGSQLFFYSNSVPHTSYLFNSRHNELKALFDENSLGIPEGYMWSGMAPKFTRDGKNLVFTFQLKKEVLPEQQSGIIPEMEIWNTNEILAKKLFIQFEKLIAIVGVDEGSRLKEIARGYIELINTVSDSTSSLVAIKKHHIDDDRVILYPDKAADFILYSVKDNLNCEFVPKSHLLARQQVRISPTGSFAFWYDLKSRDMFCYDFRKKKLVNVTKNVSAPYDIYSTMGVNSEYKVVFGLIDWMEGDDAFIIRDKYDLWQLDPRGVRPPLNLTGKYGRNNNLCFRTISEEIKAERLFNGARIVVTAFDIMNMRSGYATIVLGNEKGLKMGALHDKLFDGASATTDPYRRIFKKSNDNKHYLVLGQRADESVNLYLTGDLKVFTKLSDIRPEKEYNWLTASLINYPMKGGKRGKAILYKPDNFDSSRKYPVLFTYYQQRSEGLHEYFYPGMDININIPFYVSNGYIVVVPDIINDEPGKIARTTVNSVESAVNFLKQYAWFDSSKMGIQGQSFGGYETNLLVANSNMFAAAQPSDAPSHLAVFAQFFGDAGGSITSAELGQANLQTNLWEHPEVYIENSPFFQADKVTTPMLFTHGRKDVNVGFNQGENMYYALKRLNKPAWMILYEGGDHGTFGDGNGRQDFNIRRKQFFDHFLKGMPMPLWMKGPTLSLKLETPGDTNQLLRP